MIPLLLIRMTSAAAVVATVHTIHMDGSYLPVIALDGSYLPSVRLDGTYLPAVALDGHGDEE